MSKQTQIAQIKREVQSLTVSPFYKYRVDNNYIPVIGEGDLDSEIMFVGEAPGENEAMTGKPFIGSAGKIFDKLLDDSGIERSKVYVTNIVNDRPPNNRTPMPDEIELYAPFLLKQIDIIEPNIIITLGKTATEFLYNNLEEVKPLEHLNLIEDTQMDLIKDIEENSTMYEFSDVVGVEYKTKASYGDTILFATYHPAYALYQSSALNKMESHFSRISELV